MRNKTCELCGHEAAPGAIEKHNIVPAEILEQAGIQRTKIVRLCSNCRLELNRWNLTRIADMTYDTKVKQFRAKPPQEMVKEYEVAYRLFAKYKKGQRPRAPV
ncbi:hypothetical protein ACFLWW_03570 [Chloroflexota bacterium]